MKPNVKFINMVIFMSQYDYLVGYDFFIRLGYADSTDINRWVDQELVESFTPYSDGHNFTLTEKGKELMMFAKL